MTSIKKEIFNKIIDLIENKSIKISDDTKLIGTGATLDSLTLVELCLSLEDYSEEVGFEFDWTSEVAMSKSRSMFRTAGTLVAEFVAQRDAQKC
jgi:acyl carrier protein